MNLIRNSRMIQHLQTTSEIELFNLINDKHINVPSIPYVTIYTSESLEQTKIKIQSKKWYNAYVYDDESLGCIPDPCLVDKELIYLDYTTSSTENYILMISVNYLSCNTNPVSNISCVVTFKTDQLGNYINDTIPINIVQEAVSTILTSSNTTNNGTFVLLIGAGIILYYLTKKR